MTIRNKMLVFLIILITIIIVVFLIMPTITGLISIKDKKESVKIGGLFGLTGYASFAGEHH